MLSIFIIFFVILFICSVFIRTIVLHPLSTFKYSLLDLYHFIAWKLYLKAPTGELSCYAAHFGKGKTLSIAHYVYAFVKRYHNKKFYDGVRMSWVLQRVCVLANFEYTQEGVITFKLNSLDDICTFANEVKEYDNLHGTRTVLLCCIDEASSCLNSRNFKTNFNPLFLQTLITSRHFNINFVYSSQKFKLTDALLRSVTQTVIVCKKMWRVMKLSYYDADQVELASDTSLIKPLYKRGWFILDKHFGLYDTLATVENLTKEDSGLSWSEILDSLNPQGPDNDSISRPSRKAKNLHKHK